MIVKFRFIDEEPALWRKTGSKIIPDDATSHEIELSMNLLAKEHMGKTWVKLEYEWETMDVTFRAWLEKENVS
jgi:hypothetical protein